MAEAAITQLIAALVVARAVDSGEFCGKRGIFSFALLDLLPVLQGELPIKFVVTVGVGEIVL